MGTHPIFESDFDCLTEEKMFKAKFNDKKFKTNVRLCINRLKLVEKKKTEMALKARKEIADYLKIGKAGNFLLFLENCEKCQRQSCRALHFMKRAPGSLRKGSKHF